MSGQARQLHWRRLAIVGAAIVVAFVVVYGGVTAGRAWLAWSSIDRVEFDLEAAATAASTAVTTTTVATGTDDETASDEPPPPPLNTDYDTVLVIGSDERPEGYRSDQEEAYADALLLYLAPKDGSNPSLVSIPRDLQVVDPCTGETTKLDRTLEPCGDAVTAIEHVGLTVQEYTGVAVNDVALIDFTGFVDLIDTVGGVTLCTNRALRESGRLLLEEGCSTVDGETALRFVRSRRTQELVDDEWRFIEGVGDSSRNRRQQQLLLALFAKLKAMRSPADLTDVITDIEDSVRLGAGLSMAEAVSLAWDLRGRGVQGINRPVIPVEPGVIDDGTFVVVATTPFLEVIRG